MITLNTYSYNLTRFMNRFYTAILKETFFILDTINLHFATIIPVNLQSYVCKTAKC